MLIFRFAETADVKDDKFFERTFDGQQFPGQSIHANEVMGIVNRGRFFFVQVKILNRRGSNAPGAANDFISGG